MSDLYTGDCREVRSVLADNSVDTIITDPPYGLEFMGKGWDKGVPGVEFWREFLAVAKPGAMLLAFGGTRTFHRMTVAIEDAGWEIRDCMMWLYGSGFPKSLDISKAIDRAKGAERQIIEARNGPKPGTHGGSGHYGHGDDRSTSAPATDLARQWSGWGTALKPAWEPIIVAMKPTDGTFAENAEKWGVAGINVDGGRISGAKRSPEFKDPTSKGQFGSSDNANLVGWDSSKGRWPANLILDEDAAAMLDEQSGILKSHGGGQSSFGGAFGNGKPAAQTFASEGGASRFFYCAKASKSERNAGCDSLEIQTVGDGRTIPADNAFQRGKTERQNTHPTVKPLKLMEYLCTLTKTPTGGIVLDPFAGSGTTLLAAKNTGRQYVGIEQNPEYVRIIEKRLGLTQEAA